MATSLVRKFKRIWNGDLMRADKVKKAKMLRNITRRCPTDGNNASIGGQMIAPMFIDDHWFP